eukprot:CAMPEP_0202703580 /NCGR_PEP_ID=MMETSP1385-20130828/16416_1 /ASSEMBLY_ACC=CAM_ASM_000861 /TAXON_ID=933848 /ORGANISM="Elphidium margaritaceum" /LENGTH=152 /DNA_ID=CAMNT_0049361461 /DNA_START=6 /DNA_END=460 /DNA_ORIENTATION=-
MPSSPAIYDVFAMDAYRVDERLTFMQFIGKYGMHTQVNVSKLMMEETHDSTRKEMRSLPNLLIVHIVLPWTPKSSSATSTICATFYAKLSPHTCDILQEYRNGSLKQLPESIELFAKFLQRVSSVDGIQRRQCQSVDRNTRSLENAIKCVMR